MNAFAHIPAAVMAAVNKVGESLATLDTAYAVIRKHWVADKLSAEDGKLLLAMSLVHHLPRKYKGQLTKEGVVRNSSLYQQVRRVWATEIEQVSAGEAASIRISAAEREAYAELVASIAKANAKFKVACGDRASAVKKAMAARK